MRARGHALLLLMLAIAAVLTGFGVTATRLQQRTVARKGELVRSQALWLARSALEARRTGAATVETPAGRATVRVEQAGKSLTAVAELPRGVATVKAEATGKSFTGWTERYEAR